MLTLDSVLLFVAASAALGIAPGPDNVFVLTQSAVYGRRAGVWVTLGLCTGLLVHTALVTLGVATVVQSSAWAFNALKTVGAVYLLYLAWKAFHASAAPALSGEGPALPAHQLYVRGFLMNITNPKVTLFFLAFLPQFADPARGSVTGQMLLYSGIFLLVTLVLFTGIAWSAGRLGETFRRSARAQRLLHRVAGAVFTVLSIKLIVSIR